MLDEKHSFEILGLRENASRADVENRYYVLLKKYKSGGEASLKGATIDEVTEAYNVLTGRVVVVKEDFKPSPLLEKMGIDERKARNWLHYHKWHIVAVVLGIFAVVSLMRAFLSPRPDFNMAIIGKIYYQDQEMITERLDSVFADIEKSSLDGAQFFNEQASYEMEMKAMVLTAAAEIDLFIVDKDKFVRFGKQGLFIDLEPLANELGISVEANEDYFLKSEEDKVERLYGVNVKESSFLKEFNVVGKEMIAGIRVNAKNPEKAKEVLKLLLAN